MLARAAGDRFVPSARRRAELLRRLSATQEPSGGDAARAELARLFIADALGAEALATLDAAVPGVTARSAGGDPHVLLRGAAELLMGRARQAADLLEAGTTALPHDAELALWRAVAQAELGNAAQAAGRLTDAVRVLTAYPPRLGLRLGLTAATALARAGQADPALALLDRLAATPRSSDEIARLRVARGLALAGDAQGRAAAEAFGAAARDGLPATKILARFLAAQSADIHGLSDVARAPEELASQRPLWRGHPAERRMLDFLAGLYSRKGDHEQALSTWSAALALPSDDPPTGVITARMRDALVAALTGEGGRSDPVTAYTLYRTYPDLLADPAPVADRLAARVADVGLPGLAARLVERLLPSPDRPGRGTELARYWAAAGEPDLALAALPPGTGGPAGSAVRSQALLDLGRPAEALGELPAGHAGPDVAERRPEALWRLRDWRTLLREHQGGLAAPGPDDPPTGRDSLLLLRTAIATTAVQEGGRPGEPAPHPNDRASVFLAMAEAARPATSPVAATVAALPGRLAKLRAGLDALRRPLPDHGR